MHRVQADPVKIVVAGYMIRHPLAGNMMAFFQYLLGFQRLGHVVVYAEASGWPDSCYDPIRQQYGDDPTVGIALLDGLAKSLDTDFPICYANPTSGEYHGLSQRQLAAHLAEADLLLDIGGTCSLPDFERCAQRVLIDMDPLFTQAGRFAGQDLAAFDRHFSYGANIGRPGCSVPLAGVVWLPTQPPVVPEIWPDLAPADRQPDFPPSLSTICNWSAYGAIEYEGQHYGQKDEEFLRLLELPTRSPVALEIALAGAGPDIVTKLARAGWSIRDATSVTRDLPAYADYIAGSGGEFSAAKHAYVKTNSGWFSDRSVCYLASGKPVVVQDTGTSDWLPDCAAVLRFADLAEAVGRIHELCDNYGTRCRRARELAEDRFSYAQVLPSLIERSFSKLVAPTESGA